MKKQLAGAALIALAAVPMAANAVVYQFNANINAANELNTVASPATGVATLFYDTADNTYDFSMSVFNLTAAPSAFHIHGAATTAQNGPVRVSLDAAPSFFNVNIGGTLLVGGSNVAAPATIPATGIYPAMSFLQMLRGGLAYINVHTANFGAGEVRGQLVQVAVVPEPGTYALMLGGLAAVGFLARRRKQHS